MNIFTPLKLLELDAGDVLTLLQVAEDWLTRYKENPNAPAVKTAISKLQRTMVFNER